MVNAGQRFNQRRFSRAVFAQQRHDFAAPQAEIDVIQRLNAGKNLLSPSCGGSPGVFGGHNRVTFK
jgi:hypothetical protein